MAKQYKTLHPAKYYRDYLNHNIRPDGRELDKFRPILVNAGSLSTADGSAIVKIGKTTVVCGIKAEFCKPKPDKPKEGFLVPNVELPPLCSSKFRPGPPSEEAQVLTKLVADIVNNAQCIHLEDLCITKEKLAWCLFADIICLDYDGALIDACMIALIAALKTLQLPYVEHDPVLDNKLVNTEEKRHISVYNIPVSSTYAIFEDKNLLTDPTAEEENLSSGTLTVITKDEELCLVHKPGGSPLTDTDLFTCIETNKKRASLISDLIETAVKNISPG